MKNTKDLPSIFEADTVHVANAMLMGGGFLSALSQALIRADLTNREKILRTWQFDIAFEWKMWGTQEPQVYKGK
ncbi:MAG: hypothetical protein LC650_03940 [Actinobacteria bacterium]|nr:hypothetical protein [Actinomycetota bacterium]